MRKLKLTFYAFMRAEAEMCDDVNERRKVGVELRLCKNV